MQLADKEPKQHLLINKTYYYEKESFIVIAFFNLSSCKKEVSTSMEK